mmetsp:Transcript_13490/g.25260  ORF Transcript_13490/g.25260 Transcript_13490/m.25260 type:complete len:91 (+) Transcript_13490:1124-1396(+)
MRPWRAGQERKRKKERKEVNTYSRNENIFWQRVQCFFSKMRDCEALLTSRVWNVGAVVSIVRFSPTSSHTPLYKASTPITRKGMYICPMV